MINYKIDTLREIRINQNKKQSDVAQAAKISESYYSLIENDNRKPAIDIAYSIAKSLGLTLDEFFLLSNFTKCKEIIRYTVHFVNKFNIIIPHKAVRKKL